MLGEPLAAGSEAEVACLRVVCCCKGCPARRREDTGAALLTKNLPCCHVTRTRLIVREPYRDVDENEYVPSSGIIEERRQVRLDGNVYGRSANVTLGENPPCSASINPDIVHAPAPTSLTAYPAAVYGSRDVHTWRYPRQPKHAFP